MKKLMILSLSTGQGHNSCAEALREYFELQGIQAEVRDVYEFVYWGYAKGVELGHRMLYCGMPKMFLRLYRYARKHPEMFSEGHFSYRMLSSGVEALYEYVWREHFDTVICTHVFAALLLTQLRKKYLIPMRTAFVATDYTSYPGLCESNLGLYFIASKGNEAEYQSCGIPETRIIPTGIPVKQRYFSKMNKLEAKQRLSLSAHRRHLLIMGGGMGCGPIEATLHLLSSMMPSDLEISVICGANAKLYSKLWSKYRVDSRIHIVGYTEQVALYMDSADLCLTKPGGLSVTEAAAKRLPMVFMEACAGCEEANVKKFTEMGAADTAKYPLMLAKRCLELLDNEEELKRMQMKLTEYRQPNGARNVCYELQKWVKA